MNRIIVFTIFYISIQLSFSQKKGLKYSNSKLLSEIHIGSNSMFIMGVGNVHLSNLFQFNLKKNLSFISHLTFSYNFPNDRITDVRQEHNYLIEQKFGIGTSFHTKTTISAIFILAGLKFDSYSGTLRNSELPEILTTKTNTFITSYGLMYNLKLGRNKYYICSNFFIPIKNGVYGIVEGTNMELGVGLRIR